MTNTQNKGKQKLPKFYHAMVLLVTLSMLVVATAFAADGTSSATAPAKPSQPASSSQSSGSGGQSSSKPSKPSKPVAAAYAISKERAIELVKKQLKADDTWTLSSVSLEMQKGKAFYFVVYTDSVGDAHLRLVNAETGEVTIQSLWQDPQSTGQASLPSLQNVSRPVVSGNASNDQSSASYADDRGSDREDEHEDERDEDDD